MHRPTAKQLWAIAALIVIVALAASPRLLRPGPATPEVPFSDFLLDVQHDRVAALVVLANTVEVTRRSGDRARVTVPAGYIAGNPALAADLAKRGVRIDVSGRTASSSAAVEYLWLLLTAAFVGSFGFAIYRVGTGRALVPNSGSRRADVGAISVTFDDVAGVDEAKEEVREVVDFLRNPGRFGAVGGRIPKGILLVGPPGMGKTLLARSIAGEAKVPFLYASGSDFVEMYAGVGASRIRRLFKDARRHPACIIFIDEVDAVGRSRGGNSLTHEEREQTLNQLLVEMDGFAPNQGIVVDCGDQPLRHSRRRAAASGTVRPSGRRRSTRRQRARTDPEAPREKTRPCTGHRPARDRARHAGFLRSRPGQPPQRGGAAGDASQPCRHHGRRPR